MVLLSLTTLPGTFLPGAFLPGTFLPGLILNGLRRLPARAAETALARIGLDLHRFAARAAESAAVIPGRSRIVSCIIGRIIGRSIARGDPRAVLDPGRQIAVGREGQRGVLIGGGNVGQLRGRETAPARIQAAGRDLLGAQQVLAVEFGVDSLVVRPVEQLTQRTGIAPAGTMAVDEPEQLAEPAFFILREGAESLAQVGDVALRCVAGAHEPGPGLVGTLQLRGKRVGHGPDPVRKLKNPVTRVPRRIEVGGRHLRLGQSQPRLLALPHGLGRKLADALREPRAALVPAADLPGVLGTGAGGALRIQTLQSPAQLVGVADDPFPDGSDPRQRGPHGRAISRDPRDASLAGQGAHGLPLPFRIVCVPPGLRLHAREVRADTLQGAREIPQPNGRPGPLLGEQVVQSGPVGLLLGFAVAVDLVFLRERSGQNEHAVGAWGLGLLGAGGQDGKENKRCEKQGETVS